MDLPKGFLEEISKFPELSGLAETLLLEPETSVRFNPDKTESSEYTDSPNVPWCNEGVYLDERPQFTFDPSLHQGRYYVQDASSMAIVAIIHQIAKTPVKYLDACAAPGGKTTAALSALPANSVVLANEYDFRRAEILAENVAKWGNPNVIISRGDTKKLKKLGSLFDIVAVDAPCSGEGMMRKDTHAIEQWSDKLVKHCASTQREILSNIWDTLRPGGYIIYSTCTFNRIENEENISWFLSQYDALPVKIDLLESIPEIQKGIDCNYPCYRFMPGRIKGEGLFIAVLRKKDGRNLNEKKNIACNTFRDPRIDKWLTVNMELIRIKDEIFALPDYNSNFMKSLLGKLDILYIGVHVADIKGNDIIPTHELALSLVINRNSFFEHEINIDEAIRFLQRDNIELGDKFPKGFILLTYNNYPLGFVKNIGSRVNNLLPKQWCIKNRIIDLSSLKKISLYSKKGFREPNNN